MSLEAMDLSAEICSEALRENVMILLVEDSEDDAFFFQRVLGKAEEGGECTHLENGRAAVDFLEDMARQEPAWQGSILMFLDLKMPVLSGFDVLAWIKESQFPHPIRVVVLSGSDDPRDRARARELGAVDYFVKPVSAKTLEQEIRTARGGKGRPRGSPK